MSSIGSSSPQNFNNELKSLIAEKKKVGAGETANVINQTELNEIKDKVLKDAGSITNESELVEYSKLADQTLKSEFKGTNVSSTTINYSDKSRDVKAASTFSFNFKGTVTSEKTPPPQEKLVADGKDFNKQERETLKNDPQGGKIISRYDYLAANGLRSLTGKPELKDASLQDLSGLKTTFGNDANKFLQALKNNPSFSTATLGDAQNILKFANEGCKTKDDVISLQKSLKNVGPDLKQRFEKNGSDIGNGKGIDGQYGFATMEGVRYLSSVVNKQELPKTTETTNISASGDVSKADIITVPEGRVMVGFDVSGSMSSFPQATMDNLNKVIEDNQKSYIGLMKFDGNSDGGKGTMLKTTSDNKVVPPDQLKEMSKKSVEASKGTHRESPFDAAIQCVKEGFPKTGDPTIDKQPKSVIIYSDEPDKSPKNYDDLLKLAKENNVNVVFKNPRTRVEISLNDLEKQVKEKGLSSFKKDTNEGMAFDIFKYAKTPMK